ncbi:MAG TPA: beta-CASP ribonuclease aCPSF1, partial [Nitrososphaeraceae archaeon]|nr:beta-CASP ribonuclease aCPSF1 [Nitrososphaeraceae archaeon]
NWYLNKRKNLIDMKKNNGNGSDKNNYSKSFSSETKSEPLDKITRSHKYVKDEEAIIKTIFESIPKESQITIARFEGPNIALYTKNPRFSLTELTYYLSSLSKNLKKRFIVRTDPSIRLKEDETRSIVSRILPKDVVVSALFCDEATGEVVLEVNKPESVSSDTIISIAEATGWIAHLRRSPHIPSLSIKNIHTILKSSSKERSNFLRELGKRIFRDPIIKKEDEIQEKEDMAERISINEKQNKNWNNKEVYIFCLGGVKQVGRSCFIVMTSESKIMLDCGINPGENNAIDAYPRIDWFDFKLEDLDAIIISHAHIDHQGFLPTLFKYGYDGPVYCTEPTLPLMNLLQLDSVKISQNNGVYCPYEIRDINEIIKHCITLPYGKPTDISPDTTITLNNAGHIMGSATVHLNISGAHNILYSGDYKYAKTQLLDSAVSNYPRVETLITESTYGASSDLMPDQRVVYNSFTENINKTLTNGGKVLIPVPAVGRAQEIMLVLDKEMKEGRLIEAPIYIEGMISEASAIHMSYAHYLGQEVRRSVSQGINPFQSEYFTVVNGWGKRDEVLNDQNPAIIMATSGMLEGGPSVEYFKEIATKENNQMIFVSYQINGTLGRRVLDGNTNEVSMMEKNGKVKVIPLKCKTQKIDGFSGHSDFNQILNFVSRIKPKRVLVNHGERTKSENTASTIYNKLGIRSSVPDNREILKLR